MFSSVSAISAESVYDRETSVYFAELNEFFRTASNAAEGALKRQLNSLSEETEYQLFEVTWEKGKSHYFGAVEEEACPFIFSKPSEGVEQLMPLDSIIGGAIHRYFAIQSCICEPVQRKVVIDLDLRFSSKLPIEAMKAKVVCSLGNGDLILTDGRLDWLYKHEEGELEACDIDDLEEYFFSPS